MLAVCACLPAAGAVVAVDGSEPFIWPTTGRVTQTYGCTGFWAEPRRGSCAHFHGGIDIADSRGTPVRAVADGVIDLVGWDPWIRVNPDWMVIVDHGGGLKTMYAHLRAKPYDGIKRGERVTQGQVIGLMDSTGHATGPHLHFSVIRNGVWTDPRDYLVGRLQSRRPVIRRPANDCPVPAAGGMGAWLGGATAVVTEGDGASPLCASA